MIWKCSLAFMAGITLAGFASAQQSSKQGAIQGATQAPARPQAAQVAQAPQAPQAPRSRKVLVKECVPETYQVKVTTWQSEMVDQTVRVPHKVMVDETYKEAVVSTIDKDPRGYEILKTWLMSVDPNDLEATGDLPVEYIDRLARMMLTLTAIITSFRRRNDDPIAIGKCFGRLWATPVAWETVNAASWSTTRAQTVLKDRAGHDPFHAYDGTSATSKDPKVPSATVNTPIAVVAPLAPRPTKTKKTRSNERDKARGGF